MKMKTNELTGAALDWAVAKCEGWIDDCNGWLYQATLQEVAEGNYKPSTDWAQGGPIIERERLCVGYQHQIDTIYVPEIDPDVLCWSRTTAGGRLKYGPTPLIAAMRCYVASKLGDEIEVPDEIMED